MTGSVVWFSEVKGYGFIKTPDREKDVFFHVTGIRPRVKLLKGQPISFDLVMGEKGEQAINVKKQR